VEEKDLLRWRNQPATTFVKAWILLNDQVTPLGRGRLKLKKSDGDGATGGSVESFQLLRTRSHRDCQTQVGAGYSDLRSLAQGAGGA
jgi:hypothetical protein